MDDVRIYSRILNEFEIDELFNVSDSEPPVPGNDRVISTTGSCSINWTEAIDDVSNTSNLEYKVVSFPSDNRISNSESAERNGVVRKDWTKAITCDAYSTSGDWITVLVRDEALNIKSYKPIKL